MSSEKTKRMFDEVVAKVRANTAALDGCTAPRHNFVRIEQKLFNKWRCTHCSGEVDAHGVHWYQKGLEAGMRNMGTAKNDEPEIVVPATRGNCPPSTTMAG